MILPLVFVYWICLWVNVPIPVNAVNDFNLLCTLVIQNHVIVLLLLLFYLYLTVITTLFYQLT